MGGLGKKERLVDGVFVRLAEMAGCGIDGGGMVGAMIDCVGFGVLNYYVVGFDVVLIVIGMEAR